MKHRVLRKPFQIIIAIIGFFAACFAVPDNYLDPSIGCLELLLWSVGCLLVATACFIILDKYGK